MKIALVSRGYSLSWGGAERVTVELSNALRKAGHKVTVFAEMIEGEAGPELIKIDTGEGFSSAKRRYRFNDIVNAELKGKDFDVVFGLTQFFPTDIYWAGGGVHEHWMRLRFGTGIKRKLKTLINPVHAVNDWLEKNILKKGNHRYIVTNSDLVKGHMHRYFGSELKVRTVYNGVDHEDFNPEVKSSRVEVRKECGFGDDDIVGIFVSTNWPRKGLDTILRAMVVEKSVKLIVVGRGSIAKYKKKAESLGIEKGRIYFAGQVNKPGLYYGAADFSVLPTQYDACAGVCHEAMACALPMITTKSNGASEFIEDGVSGYILDEWDDHEALARFFNKLTDKKHREAMGIKAHEFIKGLTWERTVGELIEVCEEVVKEKGRRDG
ncbi:MAG: glycosyltransferase family 4 protein [Deltaproteobacteria bacterium]|nr:glycosyltransferase family 4 protein [Deltaproteobacteria bacterium]